MPTVRPKALQPGAKIGIVSTSSPVNPDDLEKGIACFRARGYVVELASHTLNRTAPNGLTYLAGSDADRSADLTHFFQRPDIDAVICSRGGYGAAQLMDLIDWPSVVANPKIFVGYSDLTTVHLEIEKHRGFSTFYGPMAAAHASLDSVSREQFWSMLERPGPYGLLPASPDSMSTIVGGTAEGELAGGCLCILANSCGTRFAPNFDGKIVLLEDVGDPVYRADRSLWQLRNSGVFDHAAGFVVGSLTDWQKFEQNPPLNKPQMLFEEFFGSLGKPAISGFPFGHEPNPLTLPLGVRAKLDAEARTLTLLEAAVR